MQRDMDLARQILLKIEAHPDETLTGQPTIKGWHAKQVSYHLELLGEAGLIEAHGPKVFDGGRAWTSIRLTWRGHEFLDTARDEGVWKKAKAKLGGSFNTVTLAVLQELLVNLAKRAAGLI